MSGGDVVTSWELPSWAGQVTADVVEYRHHVGSVVRGDGGGEAVASVSVAGRDDLAASGGVVTVDRSPADVLVMGVRLSPREARQLAELLGAAAELLDTRSTR